jgi:hypothetical protein
MVAAAAAPAGTSSVDSDESADGVKAEPAPAPPRLRRPESAEVHDESRRFAADSKGLFVSDYLVRLPGYVDGHLRKMTTSRVDPSAAGGATGSRTQGRGPASPRRLLLYLELSHISAADRERTVGARGHRSHGSGDTRDRRLTDARGSRWSGDKPVLLAGLAQARTTGAGLDSWRAASLLGVEGRRGTAGRSPGGSRPSAEPAAAHLEEERRDVCDLRPRQ